MTTLARYPNVRAAIGWASGFPARYKDLPPIEEFTTGKWDSLFKQAEPAAQFLHILKLRDLIPLATLERDAWDDNALETMAEGEQRCKELLIENLRDRYPQHFESVMALDSLLADAFEGALGDYWFYKYGREGA